MEDQDQTERDRQSRDIFLRAVEIRLPEAQAAYLEGACQLDASLRSRVEALLGNHRKDSFLETPAISGPPTAIGQTAIAEGPGTVIGRYTLLQRIGDGGFGAVYMAEQKEPVRRRVALKIIKLGMDTQQVVARFEAERQALAMMDHPNIARVLDGGATGDPHPQPLSHPMGEGGRSPGEGDSRLGTSVESQIANPKSEIPPGRPYFVMELVKGQTIMKFCDEHQLSTRQRLELFIPVCQAIQHAHQKGIIHRDIKPSNILIATIDGRPVPKVIDFGIAKATQHELTDKIVFTQFHQFMGTPAYMSPEQAAMDSTDIDTRSDIYSLGVLLYELLTGKTPVEAKDLTRGGYDEIRRRIREIEPPRPSNRLTTLTNDELTTVARSRAIEPARLSKLIRGELDWVVLKAMDKDRSRRYETANALALDIRRYLDNEPVTAVKPSPIYHFQKFARRHKVALATAACFVLLLTVGVCISTAQAITNKSLFTAAEEARLKAMDAQQRETELRRIAETERGNAEAERDRGQRLLYTAHMNLAKRAWDDGAVRRMVELLDLHRPKPGQEDLRNFEWFYLEHLRHSDLLTLEGHAGAVTSVAVSPDGKRLASASEDKTAKIWDATSGRELFTFGGHSNNVSCVSFSPDGKRLASADDDGIVAVWDAASGQEMFKFKSRGNRVSSVAFSPDGKRLASDNGDKTVKICDAANGHDLLTLTGHASEVSSLAYSPDGRRLASADYDGVVKVWDPANGEALLTWKADAYGLSSVAFSPDGKRLASAGWDGTVKVWDAATGQETLSLTGHVSPVSSVAFSPDGKRLAGATFDHMVKLWDLPDRRAGSASGQAILSLKGHTHWVYGVAFFPDGNRLASAGEDKTVKIWDVSADALTSPEARTLKGHTKLVWGVAFSLDGKQLASASWDTTVKVWDVATGRDRLTLKGHSDAVWSVAFSPDGKRLASGSYDRTVKLWDTANGQETLTLKGHTGRIRGVAFSPDGKRVASASFDRMVKVWDTTTGQEMLTFKGHTGGVYSVTFSPDGKRLASAGMRGVIKVWDPVSGQEMLVLHGHSDHEHIDHVFGLAFSPDGKRLASASQDQTVRVWDTASGEQTLTLKGHANVVWGVAFSPDGKRLASVGEDQTVRLWDVASGQETLTLKAGTGLVAGVAFSPDGTRLASAHKEGTVRIWDARPRSEARIPDANPR